MTAAHLRGNQDSNQARDAGVPRVAGHEAVATKPSTSGYCEANLAATTNQASVVSCQSPAKLITAPDAQATFPFEEK